MYSLIRCISSGSLCLMSIPRFLGSDLSEALRFRLQAYNSKHMFVVQEGPDQFLTRSVMLTLITVNIKKGHRAPAPGLLVMQALPSPLSIIHTP